MRASARTLNGAHESAIQELSKGGSAAAMMQTVSEEGMGFLGTPCRPIEATEYTGDKMTGLVLQWLRTLKGGRRDFHSTMVWVQCVYQQIKRATQKLPYPNPLRTSAACVLLCVLCSDICKRQEQLLSVKERSAKMILSQPYLQPTCSSVHKRKVTKKSCAAIAAAIRSRKQEAQPASAPEPQAGDTLVALVDGSAAERRSPFLDLHTLRGALLSPEPVTSAAGLGESLRSHGSLGDAASLGGIPSARSVLLTPGKAQAPAPDPAGPPQKGRSKDLPPRTLLSRLVNVLLRDILSSVYLHEPAGQACRASPTDTCGGEQRADQDAPLQGRVQALKEQLLGGGSPSDADSSCFGSSSSEGGGSADDDMSTSSSSSGRRRRRARTSPEAGFKRAVDLILNERYADAFVDLRMYAEKSRDLEEEIGSISREVSDRNHALKMERVRKSGVVQIEIRKWQETVKRNAFRMWAKEARENKQGRSAVNKMVEQLEAKARLYTVWIAFLMLRNHAVSCMSARTRSQFESLKRTWRSSEASRRLETTQLTSQLVEEKKNSSAQIFTLQSAHEMELQTLQSQVEGLTAQVDSLKCENGALAAQVEQLSEERNNWVVLANTLAGNDAALANVDAATQQIQQTHRQKTRPQGAADSAGKMELLEHPYFVLCTDKEKRRKEKSAIQQRIDELQKQTGGSAMEESKRHTTLDRLRHKLERDFSAEFTPFNSWHSIIDLMRSKNAIERMLMQFCNYALDRERIHRASSVENFSTDLQDSEVYIVTLKLLAPQLFNLELLTEPSHHIRAEAVVASVGKIGLTHIITPDDILQGRASKNFILVAELFMKFCVTNCTGGSPDASTLRVSPPGSDFVAKLERTTEVRTEEGFHKTAGCCMDYTVIYEFSKFALDAKRAWQFLEGVVNKAVLRQLYGKMTPDGEVLDLKAQRVCQSFVTLTEEHVLDILLSDQNQADELDECSDVLSQHVRELQAIYSYYASLNGTVSLTRSGLLQLLQDTKMVQVMGKRTIDLQVNKALSSHSTGPISPVAEAEARAVLEAMKKPTSRRAAHEADAPRQHNTECVVSPPAFAEALTRIAFARFAKQGSSMSESLAQMLCEHVLPNASKSCLSEYRIQLHPSGVQRLMSSSHTILKRAFLHYASPQLAEDGTRIMCPKGFNRFILECNMIDNRFTFAESVHIYNSFACSVAKAQVGLQYHDWTEAVACICSFKYPSPLVPLSQKLQVFFRTTLLPRLKERLAGSLAS